MTVGVSQVVFADDGSSSGTGNIATTQAATLTVTSGNALWCVTGADTSFSPNISGVSDSVNGSWGTILDAAIVDGNGNKTGAFAKANAGAGSTVVTTTFSIGCGYKVIAVAEISGVTASPLDGHVGGNVQNLPGTGTDAIVSGTATNATQPALVVALCYNSEGASGVTPTVGTGFTSAGSGWALGFGVAGARVESKRVTAAGGNIAKFTSSINNHFVTHVAVFDESTNFISSWMSDNQFPVFIT